MPQFATAAQISDVNEAPTAVTLSNIVPPLKENSNVTGGVKIADIAITDDGFGTNTFSLSGTDARLFAIRDVTGGGHALYYVGSSPNYETKNSYAVTVNVQDVTVPDSTPVHTDFILAIRDVNEPPTGVTLSNTVTSLTENSDVSGGVRVADISIIDDALHANTVFLSGRDVELFTIRASTAGLALYYNDASPDYETQSSYDVTVNVQDGTLAGTPPVHQDFILSVIDVLEPPIPGVNLTGTPGDDILTGSAGNDRIDGAAGNDILNGLGGSDVLTGGPGFDRLNGGGGDDTLEAKRGTGPDFFDGGDGIDLVNIDLANVVKPLTVDLSNPSILQNLGDGSSMINVERINIVGGTGADRFIGGGLSDTLNGYGGNDSLTGGPGFDKMYGGDGDDTMETKRGTGPDFFDGGNGVDLVNIDLAKVTAPLSIDLSNPSVLQNLGDGSSIINVERINIVGGTGADHFIGGALADSLNGYDGSDVLEGAGGNDTLTGGAGNDRFVFNSQGWGNDKITDFQDNLDVLDFRGSGLTFKDLLISQQGVDVLITTSDHVSSIVVEHTQLAQIAANDFLF